MKKILHHVAGYIIIMLGVYTIPVTAASKVTVDKFFKWTDEKGVIHYGDRVPPEQSQQRQDVINKQGMTVGVTNAAKTKEQINEDERQALIAAEERRQLAEKIKRDRTLLATYSNDKDLELVYQGKLDAIEGIIKITETNISLSRQTLEDTTAKAAQHERLGQAVPEALRKQIAEKRAIITKQEAYIMEKRGEQVEVKKQRDTELTRFRELRENLGATATGQGK